MVDPEVGQPYGNEYDDFGPQAYGGRPGAIHGYGNVFYPNVGYDGYGPMHGVGYGGGYGAPFEDFVGGYGHTDSGYGPVKGGGPRRGGGGQRGGRPY